MATVEDWMRIAGLLGADAEALRTVQGAVDSGRAAQEVLLDVLDDSGALMYLRADDTGMELADALAQLPRVFAARVGLDPVTDEDDLGRAIVLAGGALATVGLRLVRLPEEDGAHVLAVAESASSAELMEAGRLVDVDLSILG